MKPLKTGIMFIFFLNGRLQNKVPFFTNLFHKDIDLQARLSRIHWWTKDFVSKAKFHELPSLSTTKIKT